MNERRKHLLLAVYAYGSLGIMFLALAIWGFWTLYPYKTIHFNSIEIVNSEVKQGDKLALQLDYDRYTNLDSTVVRKFKDGLIFTTPTFTGVGEVGHYDRLVEVDIPVNLPPGVYTLETFVTYRVNPIRTETTTWETTPFTVVRSVEGVYGVTPSKSNLKE